MASWSNVVGPPGYPLPVVVQTPAKKAAKKAKPAASERKYSVKKGDKPQQLILVPVLEKTTAEHDAALSSLESKATVPTGDFNTIFLNNADNVFMKKLGTNKPFTILSIKHLLADLVHDFTKPVLDRFARDTDGTITTLINRLIATYPGMFTDGDKADLQAFYGQCTTDAAAKNRFKEALERYLATEPNQPNIMQFLTDEYPTEEGEDPGSIDFRTMFEYIYTKYDQNGAGLLFWYLDAQFGNVIDNYYKWRVVNHLGGAPNSYCRDLAYITDPASGLDTKNYTHIVRNESVSMLGRYTVMGLNADLMYASPDKGYTDAVSLTFAGRDPITITERANSVNQTYADLDNNVGKGANYGLDTRLDKILSKSGGDRFQGYSANSVMWPERPIIVTNDILASYYYIFFMNCPVLVTGQDAYKLYEFGGTVSTDLTDADAANIRKAISDKAAGTTVEKIGFYVNKRVTDSFTQVENYFNRAMTAISNGQILKFKKIAVPRDDTVMGDAMIDDKNHIYSIASDTTNFVVDSIKASKLTAALATAIIDLMEKCNIYERMVTKRANIADITPGANLIDEKDSTTKFPLKYKPLLSLGDGNLEFTTMRKYMEVFSVFSEQASYTKLALAFSVLESDLTTDGVVKIIYDELVTVLKGRVSNNNVPIYLIAMVITMIIYDVSRPTVPVRQSVRGPGATANVADIGRRKTFINRVTSDPSIKRFLFDLMPEALRITIGPIAYRITGQDNNNYRLQQISENADGTFSNTGVPIQKTKQETFTNLTIDGFLYEFNKIKGTTLLEQFLPLIGSLVSTCFQEITVPGFTVNANGSRKYSISPMVMAGKDQQLTGKAHIDSILTLLEPAAATYIANKKEIDAQNAELDAAYRGRVQEAKKKLRGGRKGKKVPTVLASKLEKPKLQKFANRVLANRNDALAKKRKGAIKSKEEDDSMNGAKVGGGSDFNTGTELLEIDDVLAQDSPDIKSLFRGIYNSIVLGVQMDDREDIGRLYALAALGDFIAVLESDDINQYYQAFLKLSDDMYIDNIDSAYFYRFDELYLCVSMTFMDAYDAGTLTLDPEELVDYVDELTPEEIAAFHATNLIGPLTKTFTPAEFSTIIAKYKAQLTPLTFHDILAEVLDQNPGKQFSAEQIGQINKFMDAAIPTPLQKEMVTVKIGGASRKSRKHRRQSRRKSSRRTQSRPKKTQKRSRRDKKY